MIPSKLIRLQHHKILELTPFRVGALLFMAGLCLVYITWGRWGNIVIDCGREMYVPVALAKGKRLYYDVWYPYGPLAPYLNSILIRTLGARIEVYYSAGLASITVSAAILFALGRRLLPLPLTAVAVLGFLAQAVQWNLFNYVLPYSSGAAYGVTLSLLIAYLIVSGPPRMTRLRLGAIGIVAGLALVDKIEFGTACYGCLAALLAWRTYDSRSVHGLLLDLLSCAPGLVFAFGVYLWFAVPGGIRFILYHNFMSFPGSYFMRHFGTLWLDSAGLTVHPRDILLSAVSAILYLAFWYALVGVAAIAWRRKHKYVFPLLSIAFSGLVGICILARRDLFITVSAFLFPSSMFWSSIVLLAIEGLQLRRETDRRGPYQIIFIALLAILLGARIAFRATPYGYSIFYDTLLYFNFLVLIAWISKARLAGTKETGRSPFWIAVSLPSLAFVASFVVYPFPGAQHDPKILQTERGNIYVPASIADGYEAALKFVAKAKAEGKSVVILPDDTAIYYLAGIDCPTRHLQMTPGVIAPGGETREYLAELDRGRVEYILVTNHANPEYHVTFFGVDYNEEILNWIRANYTTAGQIGDYNLSLGNDAGWGAIVYSRRAGFVCESGRC